MIKKSKSEKTRARLLTHLKEQGPQEATTLAKFFGITDMAVRQHLYALEDLGDICFCEVARPKGRPVKMWQLTEQANAHFPNSHAEFSTGLISSIQDVFGDQGMEKLLDVRFQNQLSDYNKEIPRDLPIQDKLEKLADIRTREGYMATIISDSEEADFIFVENNCPVCEAAKACSGICTRELDLFQETLGKDVKIKRSEHIIKGARRCAYEVTLPSPSMDQTDT